MFHSKQKIPTIVEEEEEIDLNPLKLLRRQKATLESGEKARDLSKETCFKSISDKNEDVTNLMRQIDAKDYVINNYRNVVRDDVEKLMLAVLKPSHETPIEPEKKDILVQTYKSFISDQILNAAIEKFEQEEIDKHDSVDPEINAMEIEGIDEGSQDSCDIVQMFSPLLHTTRETEPLKVVWSSSVAKRREIFAVPLIKVPKRVVDITQNSEPSSEEPDLSVEDHKWDDLDKMLPEVESIFKENTNYLQIDNSCQATEEQTIVVSAGSPLKVTSANISVDHDEKEKLDNLMEVDAEATTTHNYGSEPVIKMDQNDENQLFVHEKVTTLTEIETHMAEPSLSRISGEDTDKSGFPVSVSVLPDSSSTENSSIDTPQPTTEAPPVEEPMSLVQDNPKTKDNEENSVISQEIVVEETKLPAIEQQRETNVTNVEPPKRTKPIIKRRHLNRHDQTCNMKSKAKSQEKESPSSAPVTSTTISNENVLADVKECSDIEKVVHGKPTVIEQNDQKDEVSTTQTQVPVQPQHDTTERARRLINRRNVRKHDSEEAVTTDNEAKIEREVLHKISDPQEIVETNDIIKDNSEIKNELSNKEDLNEVIEKIVDTNNLDGSKDVYQTVPTVENIEVLKTEELQLVQESEKVVTEMTQVEIETPDIETMDHKLPPIIENLTPDRCKDELNPMVHVSLEVFDMEVQYNEEASLAKSQSDDDSHLLIIDERQESPVPEEVESNLESKLIVDEGQVTNVKVVEEMTVTEKDVDETCTPVAVPQELPPEKITTELLETVVQDSGSSAEPSQIEEPKTINKAKIETSEKQEPSKEEVIETTKVSIEPIQDIIEPPKHTRRVLKRQKIQKPVITCCIETNKSILEVAKSHKRLDVTIEDDMKHVSEKAKEISEQMDEKSEVSTPPKANLESKTPVAREEVVVHTEPTPVQTSSAISVPPRRTRRFIKKPNIDQVVPISTNIAPNIEKEEKPLMHETVRDDVKDISTDNSESSTAPDQKKEVFDVKSKDLEKTVKGTEVIESDRKDSSVEERPSDPASEKVEEMSQMHIVPPEIVIDSKLPLVLENKSPEVEMPGLSESDKDTSLEERPSATEKVEKTAPVQIVPPTIVIDSNLPLILETKSSEVEMPGLNEPDKDTTVEKSSKEHVSEKVEEITEVKVVSPEIVIDSKLPLVLETDSTEYCEPGSEESESNVQDPPLEASSSCEPDKQNENEGTLHPPVPMVESKNICHPMFENGTSVPEQSNNSQEKKTSLLEATETSFSDHETSSEQRSTKPNRARKTYRNRRLKHEEEPKISKEVDENVQIESTIQTPEAEVSVMITPDEQLGSSASPSSPLKRSIVTQEAVVVVSSISNVVHTSPKRKRTLRRPQFSSQTAQQPSVIVNDIFGPSKKVNKREPNLLGDHEKTAQSIKQKAKTQVKVKLSSEEPTHNVEKVEEMITDVKEDVNKVLEVEKPEISVRRSKRLSSRKSDCTMTCCHVGKNKSNEAMTAKVEVTETDLGTSHLDKQSVVEVTASSQRKINIVLEQMDAETDSKRSLLDKSSVVAITVAPTTVKNDVLEKMDVETDSVTSHSEKPSVIVAPETVKNDAHEKVDVETVQNEVYLTKEEPDAGITREIKTRHRSSLQKVIVSGVRTRKRMRENHEMTEPTTINKKKRAKSEVPKEGTDNLLSIHQEPVQHIQENAEMNVEVEFSSQEVTHNAEKIDEKEETNEKLPLLEVVPDKAQTENLLNNETNVEVELFSQEVTHNVEQVEQKEDLMEEENEVLPLWEVESNSFQTDDLEDSLNTINYPEIQFVDINQPSKSSTSSKQAASSDTMLIRCSNSAPIDDDDDGKKVKVLSVVVIKPKEIEEAGSKNLVVNFEEMIDKVFQNDDFYASDQSGGTLMETFSDIIPSQVPVITTPTQKHTKKGKNIKKSKKGATGKSRSKAKEPKAKKGTSKKEPSIIQKETKEAGSKYVPIKSEEMIDKVFQNDDFSASDQSGGTLMETFSEIIPSQIPVITTPTQKHTKKGKNIKKSKKRATGRSRSKAKEPKAKKGTSKKEPSTIQKETKESGSKNVPIKSEEMVDKVFQNDDFSASDQSGDTIVGTIESDIIPNEVQDTTTPIQKHTNKVKSVKSKSKKEASSNLRPKAKEPKAKKGRSKKRPSTIQTEAKEEQFTSSVEEPAVDDGKETIEPETKSFTVKFVELIQKRFKSDKLVVSDQSGHTSMETCSDVIPNQIEAVTIPTKKRTKKEKSEAKEPKAKKRASKKRASTVQNETKEEQLTSSVEEPVVDGLRRSIRCLARKLV